MLRLMRWQPEHNGQTKFDGPFYAVLAPNFELFPGLAVNCLPTMRMAFIRCPARLAGSRLNRVR